MPARPRIVLTTFGSLGDLHPYLAIAIRLRARGADPVIATHRSYRAKIEAEGVGFHEVPPDATDFGDPADYIPAAMDRAKGTEFVLRRMVLPWLRASHDALAHACEGSDLLVTHPLAFAAHVLAEKRRLRWMAAALQPIGFMSVHDPPVLPTLPALRHARFLGPGFHRGLFALARHALRGWAEPIDRLRREEGLPPWTRHPFFEGQFPAHGTLALFAEVFAPAQPDWPPATVHTGFPVYDAHEEHRSLAPGLEAFLRAGEPPIVFTLGSSAVMDPGPFWEESARAATRLGRRAVLLTGTGAGGAPPRVSEAIGVFPYAPFSELFPRAAAIVHQGGIGTTGQALAAGRPMLVMPYSHDQPDNAARCERLGVALAIDRGRYREARVTPLLDRLLREPAFVQRAEAVGRAVRAEPGADGAARELLRAVGAAA